MNSREFAEYYLKQVLSYRRGFDIHKLDEELQEEIIQELENEIENTMKIPKFWCKHIKYWHRKAEKNVPTFVGLEDFDEASGWSYVLNNLAHPDGEKWNFCPICGAKKPNE